MASADGYSARLSDYAEKGRLNLRDAPDPPRAALGKARALARMIAGARHVVLHTGAGLSTAAGIPDFRGPTGIWTLERDDGGSIANSAVVADGGPTTGHAPTETAATTQKQASQPPLPSPTGSSAFVAFDHAAPTLAHMAIVALYRAGFVKHVVSQNVDGLHLRSGLPRGALSELHGNLFVEVCSVCEMEFVREFQIESVGFQATGRRCTACGGALTDKALDWEDALPEPDFANAIKHSREADLAVVVGSSCQMNPARNLPFRGPKGGRVALINLSRTRDDARCAVTIRAKCDHVFAVILDELGLSIPRYERYSKILLRVNFEHDLQTPNVIDGLLRCIVLSEANDCEKDSIPWLSKVSFELVSNGNPIGRPSTTEHSNDNDDGTRCISTSVPFTATFKLAHCGGLDFDRELCRVRASLVLGQGADARHEVIECSAPESTARFTVLVATVDYREAARNLCEALGSERCTKEKRCADLAVWYYRSAKRRGYVRCAGCDEEVFCSKKREHIIDCVVFKRSENGTSDVTVKNELVSQGSRSRACSE